MPSLLSNPLVDEMHVLLFFSPVAVGELLPLELIYRVPEITVYMKKIHPQTLLKRRKIIIMSVNLNQKHFLLIIYAKYRKPILIKLITLSMFILFSVNNLTKLV